MPPCLLHRHAVLESARALRPEVAHSDRGDCHLVAGNLLCWGALSTNIGSSADMFSVGEVVNVGPG